MQSARACKPQTEQANRVPGHGEGIQPTRADRIEDGS